MLPPRGDSEHLRVGGLSPALSACVQHSAQTVLEKWSIELNKRKSGYKDDSAGLTRSRHLMLAVFCDPADCVKGESQSHGFSTLTPSLLMGAG